LYKALLCELTDAGMLGVLDIVSEQDEKTQTMPTSMTIQRANGFVLVGQFDEDYVTAMLEAGFPTVLLDFSFDGPDVDAVVSDGQSGCFQLTRYLIEHGHRNIGFVGSIQRTTSIMDRYSGYLRAMALANLPIRDEWIIPDMLDNTNYLTEFSFPDPLPTAFVCNNDILACQFARALENHGVRVPEDVSIRRRSQPPASLNQRQLNSPKTRTETSKTPPIIQRVEDFRRSSRVSTTNQSASASNIGRAARQDSTSRPSTVATRVTTMPRRFLWRGRAVTAHQATALRPMRNGSRIWDDPRRMLSGYSA